MSTSYTRYYDQVTPANEDFVSLAVGQGVDAPNGTTLEDEIIAAGLPPPDVTVVYFAPDYDAVVTFSGPLTGPQLVIFDSVISLHTGLTNGDANPDPDDESMAHSELRALDADDHLQYITIIYGSDNPNYLGTTATQGRIFRDTVNGISYRQVDSPSGSNWKVTS